MNKKTKTFEKMFITKANNPKPITNGIKGTTNKFVIGAIKGNLPKWKRRRGKVKIWAENVIAKVFLIS